MLATAALVLGLSGCAEFTNFEGAPRAEGPFDPGQSNLPVEAEITTLCSTRIVRGLRGLTEQYFAVAKEWERYQVYVEGVQTGKVTPEEYTGTEQRWRTLRGLISSFRQSAESLRTAGARITGANAVACDENVMVPFEKVYQQRDSEIRYVESESKAQLERLRRKAGVPES